MEEKERMHIIQVLSETQDSLAAQNSLKLHELSNQTIHSASSIQDTGSISLAIIIYALSKLIERGDSKKIKDWDKFIKRSISFIALAIRAVKEKNFKAYYSYLEKIRKSILSVSPNLKSYIQEVLKKAAINKASKIYEHGISMGQTANLLGISQWELSEYAGQRSIDTRKYEDPEFEKERAKIALDFFS